MKTLRRALTVVSVFGVCGLVSACNSPQKDAKNVEKLLESDGSGNWTKVKIDSRIQNYAVFLGPDGKYYAFNTKVYDKKQTKDQFLAAATVYSDLKKTTDVYQQYEQTGSSEYSSFSCPTAYSDVSISCTPNFDEDGNLLDYDVIEVDYGWVTTTEDIYIDPYSGLVFELGDTSSKDLESVSAAIENSSTAAIREALVSGYGLSENRASEIASLARSWKNIEKTRAMTAKDLLEFQSKVFGADLNTVKTAYQKASDGDSKDYNALVKKAAQLNGVSPEQAKTIFKQFLN